MTTETEAPAVPAVDDEADLVSGFSEVTGQEPVAPEEPKPEGDAIEAAQAELDEPAPSQEPQAPEPAPWAADLGALRTQFESFEKTVRNIAGNVGGLKSQLQKLSALPQGTPAAENAQKIVEEAIKEHISNEFPELGESLVKSMTKIVSSLVVSAAPASQVDADAIETRVMARVERRALERAHPKWEDELALRDEAGELVLDPEGKRLPSPAFKEWFATKDQEFQRTFLETVDSEFLIPAIAEFKEYRAGKAGKTAPAEEPARGATEVAASTPAPGPAVASKQRRLAAAVTPSGLGGKQTGRTELTEDEEFAAGFRAVRGS